MVVQNDSEHHRQLLEGLVAEIGKCSRRMGEQIEAAETAATWPTLDMAAKIETLRYLVKVLRHLRGEVDRVQRQRVASMLELGPEGLLAIYDLTPEQAMEKAVETLTSMQLAKESLSWLDGMDLVQKVTLADGRVGPERSMSPSTAAFVAGHEALVERLQTAVAAGGSLLIAYISRGGGHELSDEERFEMKRAFDGVQREVSRRDGAANEPS